MAARSLRFVAPGTVRIEERPIPDPEPTEVRVRTLVSAVSPGTERLVYRGEAPRGMSLDETIPSLSGGIEYPLEYGYATVGEVTATGADVDGEWAGERVFAFQPHRSHFVADPGTLHRLPADVDTEAAALLPTVETAVGLTQDAAPVLGEEAVVYGQGLVGLTTTAQLAAFPLGRLVAVDQVAERRRLAESFGADDALSPEEAREAFDPQPPGETGEDAAATGADVTIELSGDPEALDDAIAATGYAGRVVVGSWYGTKRADLDLGGRFHRSRIDVQSSQVSTIAPRLRGRWDADRRFGVAWDRLRALDSDRLLTHRFPIEDAERAYRLVGEGSGGPVGILFTYGEA